MTNKISEFDDTVNLHHFTNREILVRDYRIRCMVYKEVEQVMRKLENEHFQKIKELVDDED